MRSPVADHRQRDPQRLQPADGPADPEGMRIATLLFSTLLLAFAVGCGEVLAELDTANEMVGNGKKEEKKTASAPEEQPRKGIDWTTSKSINAAEIDDSIVSCRIGGSTQFMRRTDCVTRGGSPAGV